MYEDIKKWLKDNLTEERYLHLLGAEKTARELAAKFGVDPEKAALAALTHDCAKSIPNDELLRIIEENNLPVSEEEKKSTKILHAPVGAYIAKNEFGINDPEILDAIKYHSTGKVDMNLLEKIIFLADKIEPNTRDEKFSKKVIGIINKTGNLDEGILICVDVTIRSLLDRKLVINKQTIDVWNNLIQNING